MSSETPRKSSVRNVNAEHQASLSLNDRLGLSITAIVGTMWCAYAFAMLAFFALPSAMGSDILGNRTLLIVQWISQTFIQLVLLSVIMVGQNLQGRHAELRAEADYETNVKAEGEIESLMVLLNSMDQEKLDAILAILKGGQPRAGPATT